MPAVWTAPATWQVDQLVTNDDMNEQVRDNLLYLMSPNHEQIIRNNSGSYSTTSATFEDIDGTNLSISITTHGGPVLVRFGGSLTTGGSFVAFDFTVDGTRIGAAYTNGLAQYEVNPEYHYFELTHIITALAAGTYTIRVQWRRGSTNTVALYSATAQNPVVFEAIEL